MNNCEFCDKKGLAVLPVRPAIAPAGSNAPKTDAAMLVGADGIAVAPASYTLRHLRPGYLYTYDEARKWLHAYVVTEGGYLYKLDPGETAPAKLAFSCAPEKCGTVASCVTIPDVKRATKVWFGFSDVQWTPAVIERHKDAAYRAKHMVCLDVQAWVGSKQHKGAADISQVEKVVAEYAMGTTAGKALAFSVGGFKSKAATAQALKDRVPLISPAGGLVLSMPDPVGIASDLAILMRDQASDFANHPSRQKELAASAAIENIQQMVRSQTMLSEAAMGDQLADDAETGRHRMYQSDWMPGQPMEPDPRAAKMHRDSVTPERLEKLADLAWKRYEAKFDPVAWGQWKKGHEAAFKRFDEAVLAPLARSHAAWMESTRMAMNFQCNYDPKDVESGAVYTASFNQCIESTQDKGACDAIYSKWTDGKPTDRSNLALRAVSFNLDNLAELLEAAVKGGSLDARIVPWDNLIATYDTAVKRLSPGARDLPAQVLANLGGPIARSLNQILDGKAPRAAAFALGMISGHPLVVVDVVGSKKKFREHLIRQLLRSSGKIKNEHQIQRAVAAEMRLMQLHGEKIEGQSSHRWIFMADQEMHASMPKNLTPQERAGWLQAMRVTPDKLDDLNLSRWRTVINRSVRVGAITGLLQAVCLTKTWVDEGKAMSHDRTDATARKWAGVAALSGTTADAIGNALAGRAALGLRYGQGFVTTTAKVMTKVGPVVGLFAGLVTAALDMAKADAEMAKNNHGMARLYRYSAATGTLLGLALYFSGALSFLAVPVIGLLVGLLIGITIIIELQKNNPLQDWLERCAWGNLKNEHYKTAEESSRQLKIALDAL